MPFKSHRFLLRKAITSAFVIAGVMFTTSPSWSYSLLGPGWDGPGQGSATLTYHFGSLTSNLPEPTVKGTLAAALGVWAAVADLTFIETLIPGLPASVDFEFHPFDGSGNVLAHAFSPAPTHPEPIAGDVHFDRDETWEVGDTPGNDGHFDLLWVAIHEIGHALGLGHSSEPGAVMYPFLDSDTMYTSLHVDDLNGINALYSRPIPNPEPASFALLGTGLVSLLGYGWYRREQTA